MSTKMITKDQVPQCNFCPSNAVYDAPTRFGPWANMCEACAKINSIPAALKIGTRFVVKEKSTKKSSKRNMLGIEPNSAKYWEGVISDGIREITCPLCGMEHHMEPDSSGVKFKCHSCEQPIKVPEGIC